MLYTSRGGAPLPLAAIAALRPRPIATRPPRGGLIASMVAHAAACGLLLWGVRHAPHARRPSPAPPPLATFEMVVARQATGAGTRAASPAVSRSVSAPRPPAPPAHPKPPSPVLASPRPAPPAPAPPPVRTATAALAIPAPRPPPPTPTPADIRLGSLGLPALGIVEGHNITPPGPDATWHNSPPVYPREAQINGEHGTVEVLIHVGPDGRATSADVVQSSGWAVLDRAVLDAVRGWRFQPGQRDGLPVASELPFRVVFSRGRR